MTKISILRKKDESTAVTVPMKKPVQPRKGKLCRELRAQLLKYDSNILRAWRNTFDQPLHLEVTFRDFCLLCRRIDYTSDCVDLFVENRDMYEEDLQQYRATLKQQAEKAAKLKVQAKVGLRVEGEHRCALEDDDGPGSHEARLRFLEDPLRDLRNSSSRSSRSESRQHCWQQKSTSSSSPSDSRQQKSSSSSSRAESRQHKNSRQEEDFRHERQRDYLGRRYSHPSIRDLRHDSSRHDEFVECSYQSSSGEYLAITDSSCEDSRREEQHRHEDAGSGLNKSEKVYDTRATEEAFEGVPFIDVSMKSQSGVAEDLIRGLHYNVEEPKQPGSVESNLPTGISQDNSDGMSQDMGGQQIVMEPSQDVGEKSVELPENKKAAEVPEQPKKARPTSKESVGELLESAHQPKDNSQESKGAEDPTQKNASPTQVNAVQFQENASQGIRVPEVVDASPETGPAAQEGCAIAEVVSEVVGNAEESAGGVAAEKGNEETGAIEGVQLEAQNAEAVATGEAPGEAAAGGQAPAEATTGGEAPAETTAVSEPLPEATTIAEAPAEAATADATPADGGNVERSPGDDLDKMIAPAGDGLADSPTVQVETEAIPRSYSQEKMDETIIDGNLIDKSADKPEETVVAEAEKKEDSAASSAETGEDDAKLGDTGKNEPSIVLLDTIPGTTIEEPSRAESMNVNDSAGKLDEAAAEIKAAETTPRTPAEPADKRPPEPADSADQKPAFGPNLEEAMEIALSINIEKTKTSETIEAEGGDIFDVETATKKPVLQAAMTLEMGADGKVGSGLRSLQAPAASNQSAPPQFAARPASQAENLDGEMDPLAMTGTLKGGLMDASISDGFFNSNQKFQQFLMAANTGDADTMKMLALTNPSLFTFLPPKLQKDITDEKAAREDLEKRRAAMGEIKSTDEYNRIQQVKEAKKIEELREAELAHSSQRKAEINADLAVTGGGLGLQNIEACMTPQLSVVHDGARGAKMASTETEDGQETGQLRKNKLVGGKTDDLEDATSSAQPGILTEERTPRKDSKTVSLSVPAVKEEQQEETPQQLAIKKKWRQQQEAIAHYKTDPDEDGDMFHADAKSSNTMLYFKYIDIKAYLLFHRFRIWINKNFETSLRFFHTLIQQKMLFKTQMFERMRALQLELGPGAAEHVRPPSVLHMRFFGQEEAAARQQKLEAASKVTNLVAITGPPEQAPQQPKGQRSRNPSNSPRFSTSDKGGVHAPWQIAGSTAVTPRDISANPSPRVPVTWDMQLLGIQPVTKYGHSRQSSRQSTAGGSPATSNKNLGKSPRVFQEDTQTSGAARLSSPGTATAGQPSSQHATPRKVSPWALKKQMSVVTDEATNGENKLVAPAPMHGELKTPTANYLTDRHPALKGKQKSLAPGDFDEKGLGRSSGHELVCKSRSSKTPLQRRKSFTSVVLQAGEYAFHDNPEGYVNPENFIPIPNMDMASNMDYVTEQEFPALCLAIGYGMSDHTRTPRQKYNQLCWIYGVLDPQQKGFISVAEFQCLELSYYDRAMPIGAGNIENDDDMMQTMLQSGGVMSQTTRQKNRILRMVQLRASQQKAEREFYWNLQKLVRRRWPLIRAWRLYLDKENTYTLTRARLGVYFRNINFPYPLKDLWSALDNDRSGQLDLEEFDLKAAIVLAEFRLWCRNSHGSCSQFFRHMRDRIYAETSCGLSPEVKRLNFQHRQTRARIESERPVTSQSGHMVANSLLGKSVGRHLHCAFVGSPPRRWTPQLRERQVSTSPLPLGASGKNLLEDFNKLPFFSNIDDKEGESFTQQGHETMAAKARERGFAGVKERPPSQGTRPASQQDPSPLGSLPYGTIPNVSAPAPSNQVLGTFLEDDAGRQSSDAGGKMSAMLPPVKQQGTDGITGSANLLTASANLMTSSAEAMGSQNSAGPSSKNLTSDPTSSATSMGKSMMKGQIETVHPNNIDERVIAKQRDRVAVMTDALMDELPNLSPKPRASRRMIGSQIAGSAELPMSGNLLGGLGVASAGDDFGTRSTLGSKVPGDSPSPHLSMSPTGGPIGPPSLSVSPGGDINALRIIAYDTRPSTTPALPRKRGAGFETVLGRDMVWFMLRRNQDKHGFGAPFLTYLIKALSICEGPAYTVTEKDFLWLDNWEPPRYLTVSGDSNSWSVIKNIIESSGVCGNFVLYWLKHFDVQGSNRVSWGTFHTQCLSLLKEAPLPDSVLDKTKYEIGHCHGEGHIRHGRQEETIGLRIRTNEEIQNLIATAWVYLDHSRDGSISMQEVDKEAGCILLKFRAWCKRHFGSVHQCFFRLDVDGGSDISFATFRTACKRWEGFDGQDLSQLISTVIIPESSIKHDDAVKPKAGALALPAKGAGDRKTNKVRNSMSYEDLSFLDAWDDENVVDRHTLLMSNLEYFCPSAATTEYDQDKKVMKQIVASQLKPLEDDVVIDGAESIAAEVATSNQVLRQARTGIIDEPKIGSNRPSRRGSKEISSSYNPSEAIANVSLDREDIVQDGLLRADFIPTGLNRGDNILDDSAVSPGGTRHGLDTKTTEGNSSSSFKRSPGTHVTLAKPVTDSFPSEIKNVGDIVHMHSKKSEAVANPLGRKVNEVDAKAMDQAWELHGRHKHLAFETQKSVKKQQPEPAAKRGATAEWKAASRWDDMDLPNEPLEMSPAKRPIFPEKTDFALHFCKNQYDLNTCEELLGECSLRGKSAGWVNKYAIKSAPRRLFSTVTSTRKNKIYGVPVVPMTWLEKARRNANPDPEPDPVPDPFRCYLDRSRGSKLREAKLTNRSWEQNTLGRSRLSLVQGSFPRAQTADMNEVQKKRRKIYSATGTRAMPNVARTQNPFSTGSSQWMLPVRDLRRPYTSEDRVKVEKQEKSLITLNGLDEFFPKPVDWFDDVEWSKDQISLWKEIHSVEKSSDPFLQTLANHSLAANQENSLQTAQESSLQTVADQPNANGEHSIQTNMKEEIGNASIVTLTDLNGNKSKLDSLISEVSKDFHGPSLLPPGPSDWAQQSLGPHEQSHLSLNSVQTLVSDFDNTKLHPGRHGRRRRRSDIRGIADDFNYKQMLLRQQELRHSTAKTKSKQKIYGSPVKKKKEFLPELSTCPYH